MKRASILLLFIVSLSQAQNFSERARAICDVIQQNHIEPKPFDKEFSEFVFNHTILNLDPNHQVLLAPDLKDLKETHGEIIHDEISDGYVKFLDDLYFHYKKAIDHTDEIYTSFIGADLDFSKDEIYLRADPEGLTGFPETLEDQKDLIRKYLKKRVLDKGYELYEEDAFLEAHIQLTNDVIQNTQCGYEHILDKPAEIRHLVEKSFYDAIVAYFDPHSSYFSYHEKKLFESMLSTTEETFGLHIDQKDNGQYYVSSLIAGGKAWSSNLIHEDDEVVALAVDGEDFNLSCTSIQQIYLKLTAPASRELIIKVKTAERKDVEMTLTKETLKVDDNTIKSFVLHGDKKIGYISIPSFYTDFEDDSGTKGVAEDVAKEILKIKREGIEGLIIDLRFNGGGSVQEAIDFTGLFIPHGPVGVMESTSLDEPYNMYDVNRGQVYDGPLVVMVNRYSASASEILAGALQDYNRAIIVGSRSYGKATGQSTYFVDQQAQQHSYGYLKLTDTRLYRPDGSSNQLRGVIPDIELSDLWVYDGVGEDENMNALTELAKSELEKPFNKLVPLPKAELIKKSNLRTQESIINKADSIGNHLGRLYRQREVPLNYNAFWTHWNLVLKGYQNAYKDFETNSSTFDVKNNDYDKFLIQLDAVVKKENEVIIKNLQTDPYIEESYFILKDLDALIKD